MAIVVLSLLAILELLCVAIIARIARENDERAERWEQLAHQHERSNAWLIARNVVLTKAAADLHEKLANTDEGCADGFARVGKFDSGEFHEPYNRLARCDAYDELASLNQPPLA